MELWLVICAELINNDRPLSQIITVGHTDRGRKAVSMQYTYTRGVKLISYAFYLKRVCAEMRRYLTTMFVLACHCAVSKLCKGMRHHNGHCHVSGFDHGHQCRFLTNARSSPIAHFERSCSPADWSCGTRV